MKPVKNNVELKELFKMVEAIVPGKTVTPWRLEQAPDGRATLYGTHRDGSGYSFTVTEFDGVAMALIASQSLLPLVHDYMAVAATYEGQVAKLLQLAESSSNMMDAYKKLMDATMSVVHDETIPVEYRETARRRLAAAIA